MAGRPGGVKIMARKWILSFTYEPKIPGVRAGKIRQTIRIGRKFKEGDLVSFYEWSGLPYRSQWSYVAPYVPLTEVIPIVIHEEGIEMFGDLIKWENLDDIAREDGVNPPTGEELKNVLTGNRKIPEAGIEAQILRW